MTGTPVAYHALIMWPLVSECTFSYSSGGKCHGEFNAREHDWARVVVYGLILLSTHIVLKSPLSGSAV